jgi:hypothetical protein
VQTRYRGQLWGRWSTGPRGGGQVDGRADQADVRECLGEVADESAGLRVELLGEQADVVAQPQQALERRPGVVETSPSASRRSNGAPRGRRCSSRRSGHSLRGGAAWPTCLTARVRDRRLQEQRPAQDQTAARPKQGGLGARARTVDHIPPQEAQARQIEPGQARRPGARPQEPIGPGWGQGRAPPHRRRTPRIPGRADELRTWRVTGPTPPRSVGPP